MTTKDFSTAAVLSAVTGFLLCDIGQVYEVLNFLTADNLFTHQLPRAGRECQPWVLQQIPALAEWPMTDVTTENWRERLAAAEAALGLTLALSPIPRDDHTRRNPIEELEAMMGGKPVITVITPPLGSGGAERGSEK